jgi:hypothetical protein
MRFYNGVTEMEMASATGLQKLGVEKVKPLLTRGIVLDMAGLKGRMLRECEEITVADLHAELACQGLAEGVITPGDAVLIHTGWGDLWMKTTPGTGPANRGSASRRRGGCGEASGLDRRRYHGRRSGAESRRRTRLARAPGTDYQEWHSSFRKISICPCSSPIKPGSSYMSSPLCRPKAPLARREVRSPSDDH